MFQKKSPTPNREPESLQSAESPEATSRRFILAPSPLATVFTLIVLVVMFSLGSFVICEYRSLQLQSQGRVGSAYIENVLVPLALGAPENSERADTGAEQIFSNVPFEKTDFVMRIWSLDGNLLHSTLADDSPQHHDEDDLQVASEGDFIVDLETSGTIETNFPLAHPFLEVYAPIHDPNTDSVIAVGEIYLDAAKILQERNFVERMVWAAVALVTIGMLGMLALTFSQSARLELRLEREREITKQNDQLRRDANQARLDAAQANEQVLNVVGAELHDGPIQILGLVSLMQGKDGDKEMPDGKSAGDLVHQVMTELRSISAGLILPELEGLNTEGVVGLAVDRHKALMPGDVETDVAKPLDDLDLARKICLYRVICEGLGNAVRHGHGIPPRVTVRQAGSALHISILGGHSKSARSIRPGTPWHLGLQGMRRRLDAFEGKVDLQILDNSSELQVVLPVRSSNEEIELPLS